jgi:hypothetical protein
MKKYPCRDLNAGHRLRRPVLYPTELQGHASTYTTITAPTQAERLNR